LITANPVFNLRHNVSHVVCNIRNLEELNSLEREIQHLTLLEKRQFNLSEWIEEREELKEIVSRSAAMRRVLISALRVAQVDSTVLILGESGVGKDMLARLIHQAGKRGDRPFVKISCGAIPENLLESELFGYESGAFTGARKEGKPGLFEQAADGTVFLDEIGELPLTLQVKLLNVLQDRNFLRVGGVKPVPTTARVVAATNRDLELQVKEGNFRADLFYRLNVIPLLIPPLRERRGDLLPLINHFLELFCERHGFKRSLAPAALNYLIKYDWPGNVRELQNVMEFLVVMTPDEIIDVEHLPEKIVESIRGAEFTVRSLAPENVRLKDALEEYERDLINRALEGHETLREAAESLGIDLSTLTRKRQKYGLIRYKDHYESCN
jgi:transcriptional regulator with PAS, ATPase and Fis domain